MKSYNERLPMIDEAVEELGGKISNAKMSGMEGFDFIWLTGERDYWCAQNNSLACTSGRAFCTRTEFETRAKELGWVNGYKWGVEYEANGVKPDLPDDVLIEAFFGGKWKGKVKVLGLDWSFGTDFCSEVEKFRIVDERYKPKSTSKPEVDNWHERGELPPVGEVCKLVSQGLTRYGFDVEITYIGGGVGCYKRISDNKEFTFASGEVTFRPIQSERDKLVERAKSDSKAVGADITLARLVDAGWLPIKQQSEEEFVNYIEKHQVELYPVDEECAKKLYRAGCRFIDTK